MLKLYFYCGLIFSFILACDDPPPPMPADESYRVPENIKPEPLGQEWEKKLHLIEGQPGKEDFASNIRELTKENRAKILEILNVITEPEQEIRLLQDLSSFQKQDQGHLINIFLYLEERNKPLIRKLVQCPDCMSIFEKLKILNIIHDLDKSSQQLIEEFEKKLEEDPE